MAELPKPMTVGDEYLAAILDELKGLRADLADGPAPVNSPNGPVELREPVVDIQAPSAARIEEKSLLQRIIGR